MSRFLKKLNDVEGIHGMSDHLLQSYVISSIVKNKNRKFNHFFWINELIFY
jgi:hypothetical protein